MMCAAAAQIREAARADREATWVKGIKNGAAECKWWKNNATHVMQKCPKSNCCHLPCIAIKARAACAAT